MFELKLIKRGVKSHFDSKSIHSNYYSYFSTRISSQLNNNNYETASTSSNPYISRKLNNMDQVQVIKKEREDWMRLYHKTLKGIEAMIDI